MMIASNGLFIYEHITSRRGATRSFYFVGVGDASGVTKSANPSPVSGKAVGAASDVTC